MTYWTQDPLLAEQTAAQRRAQELADQLNARQRELDADLDAWKQELADQLNARQHPEQRANLQDAARQEAARYTNPQNAYTTQVGGPQPSLLAQLLSVREVLEEALGVANTIEGQISGPQPGQPAMLAAPDSILAVVDHIDTLANALRRQLRMIQGRL